MTLTAAAPGVALTVLIEVAGWLTIAGADFLLVTPTHPDWNNASKRTAKGIRKGIVLRIVATLNISNRISR